MTSYPNREPRTLSGSHRRMLFEESGISSEIAEERGYYTARRRSEVPEVFKDYQRRPGLVIPILTPSGERRVRLRPDRPRKGKDHRTRKYEQAGGVCCVLDVHPRNVDRLRDPTVPLWVVEGEKKGDALTSRGECAVALPGVWNWQRSGQMLPDWDHIELVGRTVYVCFDSDAGTNPNVQLALERLVAGLEDRGAAVLVVHLEDKPNGSKVGADDFFVAGGGVAELKLRARKFVAEDICKIRLSKNEKLRTAVEDLQRRWWDEEWKGRGGKGDRDVAMKLIEAAAKSGKIHADGLRVKVSWGVLQVGAKVARQTLANAIVRLEKRGFMYRDNEGRKPDKTGAFVLIAKVDQEGRGATAEENVTRELQTCDPGGLPSQVPRLRWPRSKWKAGRETRRKHRLGEISRVPEPRERIERLGKTRGAVVDYLVGAGGTLTLEELCELLRMARPYDLGRRKTSPKGYDGPLIMLEEDGIIQISGDVVTLTANWSERLEAARAAGGELEADELAERRRKLKSRAYHSRRKTPKSEPSSAGLDAVKRSHERRQAGLVAIAERAAAAARSEEQRRAEAFVRDRLRELGRIRLALLRDIWHDAGGDPWTIPQAVEAMGCRVEELPEFGNRRFVFPPAEGAA